MFGRFIPNVGDVVLDSVVVGSHVITGFGMSDHGDFGLLVWFMLWDALHEFCFKKVIKSNKELIGRMNGLRHF